MKEGNNDVGVETGQDDIGVKGNEKIASSNRERSQKVSKLSNGSKSKDSRSCLNDESETEDDN
jgi:hypothetical protein